MADSVARYIPTGILVLALAGLSYLNYGFLTAGIFSSQTLTMLISGTLVLLISTIVSAPTIESLFREKVSDNKLAYWGFIAALLLIAAILVIQGVLSGGVDYSNAVASNSTG